MLIPLNLGDSSPRQELRAGLTTFMTMAYIIVVHTHILGAAGMPREGVMVATCLAAALGSVLMGVLSNYPFALAPGMGLNAFFTYTVVLGMGLSWQGALAAVFISGLIFIALTLTRAREAIVNAIPLTLKYAISVGIGLFIALIGLKDAGIVVYHAGTGSLGIIDGSYFANPELQSFLPAGTTPASVALALTGLALTAALVARHIRGALLLGIVGTTLLGVPFGVVDPGAIRPVAWPRGLGAVMGQMDFGEVLNYGLVAVIFTFTFVDLFDTVGTLVGVAGKARMLDDQGRLPRASRALLADSLATTAGAFLGTSTTTTYVESAAGIADGGRTGWTAITVGGLFLASIFFFPLVDLVPRAGTTAAQVMVGIFMMEPVMRIDFTDYQEAIPAFFAIVMMPLAFSIAEGIIAGVLAYSFLKVVTGRCRELSTTMWVLSALFVLRFFVI